MLERVRTITPINKYSFPKEKYIWDGVLNGWYLAASETGLLSPLGECIRKEIRIISEKPRTQTWEGEAELIATIDDAEEYSSIAVSISEGYSLLLAAIGTFKLDKPDYGLVKSEYLWLGNEFGLDFAAARELLFHIGGACAIPWDYGSPLEVVIEGH